MPVVPSLAWKADGISTPIAPSAATQFHVAFGEQTEQIQVSRGRLASGANALMAVQSRGDSLQLVEARRDRRRTLRRRRDARAPPVRSLPAAAGCGRPTRPDRSPQRNPWCWAEPRPMADFPARRRSRREILPGIPGPKATASRPRRQQCGLGARSTCSGQGPSSATRLARPSQTSSPSRSRSIAAPAQARASCRSGCSSLVQTILGRLFCLQIVYVPADGSVQVRDQPPRLLQAACPAGPRHFTRQQRIERRPLSPATLKAIAKNGPVSASPCTSR